MKVKELYKKYKNQWVLAEVLKENKINEPIEVKPLYHSPDREKVYDYLGKIKKGTYVATFYTGKIPTKGYAVAFFYGFLKI